MFPSDKSNVREEIIGENLPAAFRDNKRCRLVTKDENENNILVDLPFFHTWKMRRSALEASYVNMTYPSIQEQEQNKGMHTLGERQRREIPHERLLQKKIANMEWFTLERPAGPFAPD